MRFEWDEHKNATNIRKHIELSQHEKRTDMSEGNIENISGTDWGALAQMSDADIDFSDIPPLPERFFQEARLWQQQPKVTVAAEMDADLLEWFKAESDDWEARLQAALRLYVEAHKAYS